ncbi:MAG: hypothetical protein H7269_00995 [Cellulomonas sp.]|nr:hypothetical protein [Cellulomonas sp.]
MQQCLRITDIHPWLKGPLVFVLIAVLAIIVIASIVGVFVDVQNDGYRHMPEQRTFVRGF